MNKLMYWRTKRGLGIKELAEKSGVSVRTIIRLEQNGGNSFNSTIGKLATALDIHFLELEELLEKKPEESEGNK